MDLKIVLCLLTLSLSLLLIFSHSQTVYSKGLGLLHTTWPGGSTIIIGPANSNSPGAVSQQDKTIMKIEKDIEKEESLEGYQDSDIAPDLKTLDKVKPGNNHVLSNKSLAIQQNKNSAAKGPNNDLETTFQSGNLRSPSVTSVSTPFPNDNIFDTMVAVGNNYIVATTDHSIAFLDKSGALLPEKFGNGVPTSLSGYQFFINFVKPQNADGSVNTNTINRHLGFPQNAVFPCDPTVLPDSYNPAHDSCVAEFYDLRTTYDPISKHFFILANARNHMWIENKPDDKPETYSDPAHKELVRRYIAFAVSKTEDPRDGWNQWISTESNYADWPRMSVNRDYLVIAHNSPEKNKPWAYVFTKSNLVSGLSDPANWLYYQADFPGQPGKVYPVTYHESTSRGVVGKTTTFFVTPGNPARVYSFFSSSDPWTKAPLLSSTISFDKFKNIKTGKDEGLGFAAAIPVYRNGMLYHAFEVNVTDVPDYRSHIRFLRIPVDLSSTSLVLSNSKEKGYMDTIFGRNSLDDPANSYFSYHSPAVEVNSDGDVGIVYYRYGVTPSTNSGDEVRYNIMSSGQSKFLSSASLKPAGCYLGPKVEPDGGRMDHGAAMIDPANTKIFWFTHGYCQSNMMQMAIGKVPS